MRVRLLRNATLIVEMGGARLLVDPMLAPVGALPAVDPAADPRRNPLVPLPVDAADAVRDLDAALVTHLHRDHFDADAAELLPPATPILTQPHSAPILAWMGFTDVRDLPQASAGPVEVTRTPARHTLDPRLAVPLGPTCGFLLAAPGEPRLLIAGDCVWCPELAEVLERHAPDVVIVNAGAGRIGGSGPISMDAEQVLGTAEAAAGATVAAVHLEALSHCPMTRAELAGSGVLVPGDGDWLEL